MDLAPELLLRIESAVTEHFLESGDFNGVLASALPLHAQYDPNGNKALLQTLVEMRLAELMFAVDAGNPYIKRLPSAPLQKQLALLATEAVENICVYPCPEWTSKKIGATYDERPYTKRLALVEAQLVPVYFELIVLERYFRDPRFDCWFGDSNGNVTIGDAAYLSEGTSEKDKISFKFGIGYDENRFRVVAVFLYELASLSAEHQQAFRSFEISGPCVMNSDFERAMIWGLWGEYESVYHAFIQEQVEINRLCSKIGKPPLFRATYEDHARPLGFAPMLRPTRKEYEEFMHLLDKMSSDNLNREFFKNDIPLEEEIERADGRLEIRQLATINLLERWFKRRYRTADGEDGSAQIVAGLRAVRKARQPAAHAVRENEYDLTLPVLQDEMLGKTKETLTLIRWALTSHPRAKGYKAPEWLDGDKIVFF